MEFNINVNTNLPGKVIIEDYSREYDQYFSENSAIQSPKYYKYSESKTLNILTKIDLNENEEIINMLIHNHDQLIPDPLDSNNTIYDLEKSIIFLNQDGYYKIHHIILPTKQWYDNTYNTYVSGYKQNLDILYIIDDTNNIQKYNEKSNSFESVELKELICRNIEGTTIKKCIIDVFYTGFLQECYINYCKQLFQKLTKNCNYNCIPENIKEITYIRDFLWMTLNIIDYNISCKQYIEAQRLLELVNYCGGFCKNQKLNINTNEDCGCSKN